MIVSVPFTLKDYPKTLNELRLGNDFAALPMELRFPDGARDLSSFKLLLRQNA
jgi:hypothetical protein